MDVKPPDCCTGKPVLKKCIDCYNKYFRDYMRDVRKKEKEKVIKTRSVILKKRSLYYDILCLQCKDKTFKDFCSDCVLKYNNEKSKKRYRSKKQKLSNKVDLDHQTSNNHLNSIKQIIPDCSVIKENSPLIINNESDVISVNKKVSIYAHLLCNDCQTKSTRSFCPPCKKNMPVLGLVRNIMHTN